MLIGQPRLLQPSPALEWILTTLLHCNSLHSHAVARFTADFGLKPPCLLCSCVDRLFGAEDVHRAAGEISRMGYCLLHHRLVVAAAVDMCEVCLSSSKNEMMKDAEETGCMACSCCKALVQVSSSRELENTHTTRGKVFHRPIYPSASREIHPPSYGSIRARLQASRCIPYPVFCCIRRDLKAYLLLDGC